MPVMRIVCSSSIYINSSDIGSSKVGFYPCILKTMKDVCLTYKKIIKELEHRHEVGVNKYWCTVDDNDLTRAERLQHAKE